MQLHEPALQKKEQPNAILPASSGFDSSLAASTWLLNKPPKPNQTQTPDQRQQPRNRIQVENKTLPYGRGKKKGKELSSPLDDYMNKHLLPGNVGLGSSVVLGKELSLFVYEEKECSQCFF